MGAKAWMLLYVEGDPRPILRAAPTLDREATRTLVRRLHPGRRISEIGDGTLLLQSSPEDGQVYATCLPGLTIVCTEEAFLTEPSELDQRFLDEAAGRTTYLVATHSGGDWFAYAIWDGDGTLRRSFSASGSDGVSELVGDPLPFEAPYLDGDGEPDPYEATSLGDDAMRELFGVTFDEPALEKISLAGFEVT
ncbi:DUF6928 family protein [Planotetraspora kaengkrachanensis]|uniref:Uncharacterized protein n=1 Tax=Planotetraspora kaengkrachanensis TaxID=575193 RepID=A0A8J3V5H6_9ACTN|nr:hypothetical protein [Planotetraspora kaengkrachanensis]GIG81070.1 hypothetical protein Pka01_41970 [Planotetraspora kaengkrachanensis]